MIWNFLYRGYVLLGREFRSGCAAMEALAIALRDNFNLHLLRADVVRNVLCSHR